MITGVTKAEQVLANAAAADWVLSVDDLVGIEAIVGAGCTPGSPMAIGRRQTRAGTCSSSTAP